MDSIALLLEEYKIVGDIGEKYFDRMYAALNYTIVFYGAILALTFNNENFADFSESTIVFYYLLPVGTYLFGLFYAYNSYAIAKQGYHSVRIERAIFQYSCKAYNRISFYGWNTYPRTGRCYTLAYGTALMFFVLAPVFDFFWGLRLNNFCIIKDYVSHYYLNIVINILPFLFYMVYVIFMIIIIVNIIVMARKTNNIRDKITL